MQAVKLPALVGADVLIYSTLEDDLSFEMSHLKGGAFISVQSLSEMHPNLTGPKISRPDSPELAAIFYGTF